MLSFFNVRLASLTKLQTYIYQNDILNQQSLDFVLDGLDLRLEFRAFVGGHRARNNWAGDAAGTAERLLRRDKDVRDVLVFAEQGEMQQNLEGLRVGSHHDELRDASVQRLGRLVGALFQLLVVGGLLDQVENLGRHLGVWRLSGQKTCLRLTSQRKCFRVDCFTGLLGKDEATALKKRTIWITSEGKKYCLDNAYHNRQVSTIYGLLERNFADLPIFQENL